MGNSQNNMRERSSEEARNAYLVVATLVATATYQAALSPPGGLGQINAGTNNTQGQVASNSSINEGKSSMTTKDFISFSATNSFAFLTSTVAIIGLLPKRNVAWVVLYLSMALLAISYMKSVSEISPLPLSRDVVEWIFSVLFTIFAMVVLPIFLD
ncbi:hypothetical protein E2542_SST09400 [Spatholobus suberectus]|nr:hypothetical protein E2542_SST09400 [Spatholobus suberectus]